MNDNVYLAVSVRNVGTGLAVLQGWDVHAERRNADDEHTPAAQHRRMIRDLYIPAHDVGYWHAAIRDPADPRYAGVAAAIKERRGFTVEVLYSDHDGGQSSIIRFIMRPRGDEGSDWITGTGRHWNLDRPDPRSTRYL